MNHELPEVRLVFLRVIRGFNYQCVRRHNYDMIQSQLSLRLVNELPHIAAQFSELLLVDIHHMPGFIIAG